MSVFERAKLCHKIADVMEKRKFDLARILSLDQGKPFQTEAIAEVEDAILAFHMASEDIKRLYGSVIPSADLNKRIWTIRQLSFAMFGKSGRRFRDERPQTAKTARSALHQLCFSSLGIATCW